MSFLKKNSFNSLNYNKKRISLIFFLHNFFKFKLFLNKFVILFLNKKKKNIFINFSNLYLGNIIFKISSGFFFKKSQRKTYYSYEYLFKNIKLPEKFKFIKKFFFLNIKGNYYEKGFKKVIKNFLLFTTYNFIKLNNIKFKAHNGVRSKKQKRK